MKKFLTSLGITALILSFSLGVLAAPAVEKITAYLAHDTKVVVNNTAITAKPINYNNTTYLPVRELGDSLGLAVNYDEGSKTVYVGERAVGVPITMETYETGLRSGFVYTKEAEKTNFAGIEYEDVFYMESVNAAENVLKLLPAGKYQKLVLQVGVTGTEDGTIRVLNGQKELVHQPIKPDEINTIEVNIEAATELKVEIKAKPGDKGKGVLLTSSHYK